MDKPPDVPLARAGAEQLQSEKIPHPRDVLSDEARSRIQASVSRAVANRQEVEARIESRWLASGGGCDIKEYVKAGEAAVELDQVRIDQAKLVLPVLFREYLDAGYSGTELWRLMTWEVDLLTSDLDLRPLQRNVLLSLLRSIWDAAESEGHKLNSGTTDATEANQGRRKQTKVVPISSPERAEKRRAFVDPILRTKGWSVYRWEKEAGVTSKVGQRYYNGTTNKLRIEQRQKLAKALEIDSNQLPD